MRFTACLNPLAILLAPGEAMPDTLSLTHDGKPAASLAVLAPETGDSLEARGAALLRETVRDWSGAEMEVVADLASAEGPAVIVTTEGPARERLGADHPQLVELAFLDDHAFVGIAQQGEDGRRFWIVGKTARGAYNGAVYARDFLVDGPAEALELQAEALTRTPHMPYRPVYILTIWGEEDEYAVEDWIPIFDSFMRDGVTHLYFWLSGHFPSEKFPQSYKVQNKNWDSTRDTRIGTIEDQRRLIEAAHARGMEFFIGGGMGAWSGSFNLTNREPDTMRVGSQDEQGNDVSLWALCPAEPASREALIAHYKEMFDALPEADGLYIESADELGECQCEKCRVPVDDHGSRMFGQYQMTLVQEMMNAIWADHPDARLSYTIGYSPHTSDPAYYELVRRMSDDPRVEWMESRGSWEFPGPGGKLLPPAFFSPRVLHWEYNDIRNLETIVNNQWQTATAGMPGIIMTFSPGFSSGSFYHEVPFPTDKLPYRLTHFVYREGTWSPVETVDEIKARVRAGFFSAGAPEHLAEDLWNLREILFGCSDSKILAEHMARVEEIGKRVEEAHADALPKTAATLDLMQTAIADIRERCVVKPSD